MDTDGLKLNIGPKGGLTLDTVKSTERILIKLQKLLVCIRVCVLNVCVYVYVS